MHHGILGCAADAPLSEVAGVMAEHRIHAVALNTADGRPPLAVVSDLDVVSAAASWGYPPAIQAAATEPLAVSADETLLRAAQLEHPRVRRQSRVLRRRRDEGDPESILGRDLRLRDVAVERSDDAEDRRIGCKRLDVLLALRRIVNAIDGIIERIRLDSEPRDHVLLVRDFDGELHAVLRRDAVRCVGARDRKIRSDLDDVARCGPIATAARTGASAQDDGER